ncbi:MAG: class F sortase [Actinomycetota bacterium]
MNRHAAVPVNRSVLRRVGVLGLRRSAALLLLVLLVGVACGSATDLADGPGPQTLSATPVIEGADDASSGLAGDGEGGVASSIRSSGNADFNIADKINALPPAQVGIPFAAPPGPQPIGLTIESLGVSTAGVLSVGVEDNGDMEIPPADRVGWYRFGASPGDPQGSAVLAAHIAFDGQDGVFVNLDKLELGSLIQVQYDDGTVVDFVATALEQYDKTELPKDNIFDRSGEPQLVLITCGGDFNREVRSYEDNVVVYASPVDQA